MKNKMRLGIWLVIVLAAAGLTSACMGVKAEGTAWKGEYEAAVGEDYRLQENLALWYNHGQEHGEDPEVLAEAYPGILDYGGGLMGYLEVAESGVCIPIYHGPSAGVPGLFHDSNTPFPIGNAGSLSVLTGRGGQPELKEGDVFYIHILDSRIPYRVDQVTAVGNIPTYPEPEQGAELCILLPERDGYWRMICGSREDKHN